MFDQLIIDTQQWIQELQAYLASVRTAIEFAKLANAGGGGG